MNKIGILGGAFNPIHFGHLFIAKEAMDLFSLKKIIFVPTGNPVFPKEDLLNKRVRAEFVKTAVFGEKQFELSLFEVERDAPSFFINTLKYFKTHFKTEQNEIFVIIGEDAFLQFHRWRSPEEILNISSLIVAKRYEGNFEKTKNYVEEHFIAFKDKIHFLSHPLFPISSTLIRKRIKEGKSISYLLPKNVEEIIIKNGYYR